MKNNSIASTVSTVDLAPSWAACVDIYVGVLLNPRAKAENINGVIEELRRMAKLADAYATEHKAKA